ncbi:hypothetical protein J4218_05470 [Candidatus Pacearchaeota archaeon]|nr:hypothetical protein [Candidatus Pacearchaeota archaeon]
MRKLYYYPTCHLEGDFNRVMHYYARLCKKAGRSLKDFPKEVNYWNDNIPAQLKRQDEEWGKFLEWHREHSKQIDCVFLEGKCTRGSEDIYLAFKQYTGAMSVALLCIASSKGRMEITENRSLFSFAHFILPNHIFDPELYEIPNRVIHELRERYVTKAVDKKLRQGETGLLLFGGGHRTSLEKKLSKLNLKLEIIENQLIDEEFK